MAESIAGQGPNSDFLLDLLQQVDRQQLSELAGVPLSEVNQLLEQPTQTNIRKLDIEMPGGFTLRNTNSDDDMNRAVHILQTLNLSVDSMAKLLAGPNPTPIVPVAQAPVQKTEEGGTTIQEMVPRYATRKRDKLAVKTLYEYGNYHRKFVEWLELRKKKKHIADHLFTAGHTRLHAHCHAWFRLPCSVRLLKCCFKVFRLAPVSLIASAIVTRPCSRANSTIVSDNSGRAASTIFSRSTFFSNRRTCSDKERRKNTNHGCQFGVSVRMLPCVCRNAR